jgi:hypothetical protein
MLGVRRMFGMGRFLLVAHDFSNHKWCLLFH